MGLSWGELQGQRALARLRLRLVRLTHVGGALSWARRQQCICCGTNTHSPTMHVLAACAKTGPLRQAFWQARGTDAPPDKESNVRAALSVRPGAAGYAEAAALAVFLEREEAVFWAGPRDS